MIEINDAIQIHEILIYRYGGSSGIRDIKLLESAIARPFHTFDKKELYQFPEEKAAALIESILINHPFIDGNKRIGYVLMRLMLTEYGYDISSGQEEKYKFVISIAQGNIHFSEIVTWIRSNIIPLEK